LNGSLGVTGADAELGSDVPIAFVAVAVNVYDLPLVRSLIKQLVPVVVQVLPSGLEVTV
jgi:hypothetical protein